MAPPWMASQQGAAPPVDRISGLGWDYLGIPLLDTVIGGAQAASNPVAAMPSLHAASAALVLFFCWPIARWPVRAVMLVYAAAMGLVVVYTGEHYVVDVLVGWGVAGAAVPVSKLVPRRSSTSSSSRAEAKSDQLPDSRRRSSSGA